MNSATMTVASWDPQTIISASFTLVQLKQQLHPDYQSNPENTQYFFIGTGKTQLAIQWSRNTSLTPLGLLFSNSEHFTRKWSTHLFHPELGLERTQLTVIVDGERFRPDHNRTTVDWDFTTGEPRVRARWHAGNISVTETFDAPLGAPGFVREIELANAGAKRVEIELALYASSAIYDWFGTSPNALFASGYDKLWISSEAPAVTRERFMVITPEKGSVTQTFRIFYSIGAKWARDPSDAASSVAEIEYWRKTSSIRACQGSSPLHASIEKLFATAKAGLRSAIAESGKFDASIWQYNFEWTGDAAMVAEALVYSGQLEVAKRVLDNILSKLSNAEGMVMESSRFRGGRDAELNNNGEVLHAACTYWQWSGDEASLRRWYPRLKSIADYLLNPEFLDEQTGMLKASRDIWERMEAMGIRYGYDIAHQTFAIGGLNAAATMAESIGDSVSAARWHVVAQKMERCFLEDSRFSFIEHGRLIKRRLVDGSVQYEVSVDHEKATPDYFKNFMPAGMPLASEGHALWEPDVSETFPICSGIVEPTSDVAHRTMQLLEMLWSQDWDGGGYGRYNVLSEPDSPGPWPFATCYMASAYLEIGETAKALRAIEWLASKAKAGGSWFEFYGYRPTPPLPPTGVIVWGWAQFITLIVKHLLNARVEQHDSGGPRLSITPRMSGFEYSIPFRGQRIS